MRSRQKADRENVARIEKLADQFEKACLGRNKPVPAKMLEYLLNYVKPGTLDDIAASAKIDMGDLRVIMNSYRDPTPEEAHVLAEYFGVPVNVFNQKVQSEQ